MFAFTFHDLLAENARSDGRRDRVAIIDSDGRRVRYAELAAACEGVAAWLSARGVVRGDRIGIHMQKSVEEAVGIFAAARLGAVFVDIHFQWTAEQLDYVLRDCQVRALFVDERRARRLAEMELPDTLQWVIVRGKAPEHPRMVAWEELGTAGPPAPCPAIDRDLAAILYTSGSSGPPKGVMLTHANLIAGARSVACYLENEADDRLLSLLPFSFDYGLSQLTTMCLVGGAVVLQKVAMAAEIVRTLSRERITGLAAVPPTWNQLVQYLLEEPASLPDLRYLTNSGGKIPRNVLQEMPAVFPGARIYLMYGLTEAFRSTYLRPERFSEKMGSIGRAIPNAEIFVVAPGRGPCGPGEEGELIHRGALVSAGYWGKPAATAEKIRPCPELRPLIGDEPVLYSGDIVQLDEDGDLWFVGRRDGLIKSSGFRISPTEVEELVAGSGMVAHVVAFGTPDDILGQVVEIAVAPAEGAALDSSELMAHCRRSMPSYMVPRRVHVWQGAMPRTGSGKLDRTAIVKTCQGS